MNKKIDLNGVLEKARKYCAYQERCQQEVRNKLYEWEVYYDLQEEVIATLISENFINEERFAKIFAGGKFRIKKWGRIKIRVELEKRSISEYSINKGMKEIGERDYQKTLKELAEKKLLEAKEKDAFLKKQKVFQQLLRKGYETDLIKKVLAL